MKIVVMDGHALDPGDLGWQGFEALGEFEYYDRTPPQLILPRMAGAGAVLVNKTPITAATLAACPDLRYIGVLATGYNVVDTAAAAARGIPVCNVPDYAMQEVAMHQVALIMALCRKLKIYDQFVHSGEWTRQSMVPGYECRRISTLTVGLLGLGRIARNVAKTMLSMGATVCTHDPYLSREAVEALGVKYCATKDELLAQSDVISANIPLTDESYHMTRWWQVSRAARSRPPVWTSMRWSPSTTWTIR